MWRLRQSLKQSKQRTHATPAEASLVPTYTPARARTVDKLIKSQLLYQLSYGGFLCRDRATSR